MRLPAFPVPVPGETVHSVVARFMARTAGSATWKLASLALRRKASDALLPTQLGALASVMPPGHPWCDAADVIVNRHSLVPLFLHFADRSRATDVEARLAAGSSSPASMLGLSVSAGNASRGAQKFCPACVEEDRARRGFAVGYRQHQPDFVRVCAEHRVPLRYGCSKCHSSRLAARRWSVVGECGCETPQFSAVVELGTSDLAGRGWQWLSEQVRAMLVAPTAPRDPLLPVLRDALVARGLLGEAGAGKRIHDALIDRFGEELLVQVGAISGTRNEVATWPLRLLGARNTRRAHVPSCVRALLLMGLVGDDLAALIEATPRLEEPVRREPSGYGSVRPLARAVGDRSEIVSALAQAENNVFRAAEALAVSPAVLAVDMRRQGISLPLSAALVSRVGADTLQRVRASLNAGVPKVAIQREHKISEWTLQLIELAEPELAAKHRVATVDRTRRAYRDEVEGHIRLHGDVGREAVARAHPKAVDWLRRFDAKWFREHVARKSLGQATVRKRRRPWHRRDAVLAERIEKAVRAELGKSTRPVRLTPSSLLTQAGARSSANAELLPRTTAAAGKHSETSQDFERRKIGWALKEYTGLSRPLSMNLFRRLVGMPPERLKRHAKYIAERAFELEIPIDGRCVFSRED